MIRVPPRDHPADTRKISVSSLGIPSDELARGAYALTDDLSDEHFEEAIEEAKADGSLARANVLRKIKDIKGRMHPVDRLRRTREMAEQGYSSRQIAKQVGLSESRVREIARDSDFEIRADIVMNRQRRHDSNRIVRETVHALDGLAMGVGLVDFDELDPDEIEDWTISLANSIRALNRLNKKMKEMVQ